MVSTNLVTFVPLVLRFIYIYLSLQIKKKKKTIPEISFSVNKVCQFMSKPSEQHWLAVKRILRYLKGTVSWGLHFPDDRKSTSGAAIFLGPNLISWWSKKQSVVARSSTEAEYRSMALIAAEVTSIQSLLSELQVAYTTPIILYDKTSTASLAYNHVLRSRIKYMELDLFFVREKVLTKTTQCCPCSCYGSTS